MRLMPALALLAFGVPAAAQQAPPLKPGVPIRVRFTLPGEGGPFTTQATGALHALTADSVLIRQATGGGDSQVVRVPRPVVIRAEYFTGATVRTRTLPGLWALGGAVAGVLIGAQTVRPGCGDMSCGLPPLMTGGAVGALAGYAAGNLLGERRREVWQTVDLTVPDSTKPGSGQAPGLRGRY